MNIDSIQNGIVIDHISAGNGMKLYELLELNKLNCSVALLRNVSSNKLGRKEQDPCSHRSRDPGQDPCRRKTA